METKTRNNDDRRMLFQSDSFFFFVLQNISHKPRKENSKLENGKQTTPRVEPVADQESEKDKEIARLKLQNAQIKMR